MLLPGFEMNPIDPSQGDIPQRTTPQSFGVINAKPLFDDAYPPGAHPQTEPVAVAAFMILSDTQVGWGFHAAFTQWFRKMQMTHREEGVDLNFDEWIGAMARSALTLTSATDTGRA